MRPHRPAAGNVSSTDAAAAPFTATGGRPVAVPHTSTTRNVPDAFYMAGSTNLVSVAAFAVAVLVIWQVFRPLAQGSQFYLIVFLAGLLPLVFLVYRSGLGRLDPADRPGALDWVLAAVTLLVCLYPVLPVPIGPGRVATTRSWTGRGCSTRRRRHGRAAARAGRSRPAGAPPAGRCRWSAWLSSPTATTAGCCRRTGRSRTPGWTSIRSSTRSTTRAAASTAPRWTSPPPTSCCSPSTARCSNCPGASRFFVDLSVAAFRRSRSAAGRTAVASGFLLGTVSGSGTATAVSVGAVTWPILRRAGYPAEQAGGMLAAAGVGAILSPPTLGRRRVHRRRVPRRLLPDGARLGDDPDRSCTTWASCSPSRSTRGGSASRPVERRRPVAVAAAAAASATTSRRWS